MTRTGTRVYQSSLLLGLMLLNAPSIAQDLPGTSEWSTQVTLSTTANGMISKVNVAAGDEVVQGAVLVELDPRAYQSELAAAESLREAAQQLNQEARRELDRTLELFDRTLISDHERKLAEIELAKSDAALREAEAKLTAVRLQRDYSRINAPFDGRVVAVHVQPGEAVVNRLQAQPLVTLVDHRRMLARAQVDDRTLVRLKVGDKVQVGIRGVWLDGEIASLGYDPVSRSDNGATYHLDVRFTPGEEMALRSGEKLVIRLADE
ncbi:MAG: efflux RND transporter periplasmic adaptor subunit [Candidatus Thiodiazotropha sp.]|jgi:RND family efflux transporter MFP subunit